MHRLNLKKSPINPSPDNNNIEKAAKALPQNSRRRHPSPQPDQTHAYTNTLSRFEKYIIPAGQREASKILNFFQKKVHNFCLKKDSENLTKNEEEALMDKLEELNATFVSKLSENLKQFYEEMYTDVIKNEHKDEKKWSWAMSSFMQSGVDKEVNDTAVIDESVFRTLGTNYRKNNAEEQEEIDENYGENFVKGNGENEMVKGKSEFVRGGEGDIRGYMKSKTTEVKVNKDGINFYDMIKSGDKSQLNPNVTLEGRKRRTGTLPPSKPVQNPQQFVSKFSESNQLQSAFMDYVKTLYTQIDRLKTQFPGQTAFLLCGDQRNDEWFKARSSRLTSSNFGKIFYRKSFAKMEKCVNGFFSI